MKTALKEFVGHLKLGDIQTWKHIAIVPLTGPADGGPTYLTLDEALESQQLLVTEVSQAGCVPELKVNSRSPKPVLLLDGEELLGAKQNRVLNTTILLRENAETIIPVSCTEQGRWAHVSAAFRCSDAVMAHKARARKHTSVSSHLAVEGQFRSDQGEVWHEIAQLNAKAQAHSPTVAMHDVFESLGSELEKALPSFSLVAGQLGFMALIDGEVAGFDVVSRPEAYARLHAKLLKSYLIDALLESKGNCLEPAQALKKARAFLKKATQCEEKRFPSIGYGVDCRFKKSLLAGTALVHEDRVVHAAFFQINTPLRTPSPEEESEG